MFVRFLFFSILLAAANVFAQTPIGLYEGLLGNSGAALQDSSAASFYNPSLLILKNRDSHIIGGNTFSRYSSESNTQNTSSVSVYPTYLSTVFSSESLMHEIFVVNLTPTRLQTEVHLSGANSSANSRKIQDVTNVVAGYSMAFKSVPFAMSYYVLGTQIKESAFSDFTSLTGSLRSTAISNGELSRLSAGLSVSGHARWPAYTLGYTLKTRPAILYSHNRADVTSYIRGETLPTDYRVAQSSGEIQFTEPGRHTLTVGHDFRTGIHEFLTDSVISEDTGGSDHYHWVQSFGYRLSAENGHQFLCGVSHGIGGDVRYLGQQLYLSTGYSWERLNNRSTVGLYYFHTNFGQDIISAGLTFGSEFSY